MTYARGLFFISVLFCSCTADKGNLQINCEFPDTVSFSNNILPIFIAQCNSSGCHSGGTPAAGLDLTPGFAHDQLMNGGYVDTLDPEQSILYTRMNDVSAPMPPIGKLSFCEMQMVLRWIKQKAKNN